MAGAIRRVGPGARGESLPEFLRKPSAPDLVIVIPRARKRARKRFSGSLIFPAAHSDPSIYRELTDPMAARHPDPMFAPDAIHLGMHAAFDQLSRLRFRMLPERAQKAVDARQFSALHQADE